MVAKLRVGASEVDEAKKQRQLEAEHGTGHLHDFSLEVHQSKGNGYLYTVQAEGLRKPVALTTLPKRIKNEGNFTEVRDVAIEASRFFGVSYGEANGDLITELGLNLPGKLNIKPGKEINR